jgi:hypothetical protein
MVQGNAALGRTAYYTGMSARELDAWRGAVKSAGGTAEGFEASVKGIQAAFQALRYGQGDAKVAGIFKSFGIAYADAEGKARPMKDVLLDLASVFNKMKPQDQLYLAQQLGLDEGTLNLLRQGKAEVQSLYDTMYKASGVTDKNIEAATKLQKRYALLKQEISGVSEALFGKLVPALERTLDLMIKIFQQTDKSKGAKSIASGDWWGASFELSATDFAKALVLKAQGKSNEEIAKALQGQEPTKTEQSASGKAPASGAPRGIRNNNPGNLRYGEFAQRMGATGQDDKGFAVFSDMKTGSNAGLELLKSYMRRGYDTIEKIISRWAPANENDTGAYIAAVSKSLGVGSKQKLNDQQLAELSQAIFSHENGPGYRQLVGAGVGAGNRGQSNTTVETKINTINVQTAATDANGIARDMKQSLQENQLVTASVSNLS